MKNFILSLSLCLCALPFVQAQQATVYTTAKDSPLRISESGIFTFEDAQQPLESQPCIFVDATHAFQTFIGIGGAFTDAAAETFAKLPQSARQEFLTACYDTQKGIG